LEGARPGQRGGKKTEVDLPNRISGGEPAGKAEFLDTSISAAMVRTRAKPPCSAVPPDGKKKGKKGKREGDLREDKIRSPFSRNPLGSRENVSENLDPSPPSQPVRGGVVKGRRH